MKREDFTFRSRNQKDDVHAVRWIPEGNPRAVLQICHGMAEHIGRYGRFAEFLADNGILVTGHDHIGHGTTAANKEELGYFDSRYGNEYLIADIHRLRGLTRERYPGIPYFLMGHSMGSFLARQYICLHGEGLAGAIIMGTGVQPSGALAAGRMLCSVIGTFKGTHYRSAMVDRTGVGGYNRAFEPARTPADWLTRDEEEVDRYMDDPLCGFCFTVSAYNQMMRGIQFIQDKKNLEKIPKRLPVFLVSGGEDPVGGKNAEGVQRVYEELRRAGMMDVLMKIYPGDRHELLNERNYRDVQDDLLSWMLSKLT